MFLHSVSDIRTALAEKLADRSFVVDKSGVKTIELVGTSFGATEPLIFGAVNDGYVARELEWYKSQSLRVDDIPGGAPEIWKQVADSNGRINSNYGYLIWSQDNYSQYANTLEALRKSQDSRRAIMIYTRPIMHYDYDRNGMSDFVCTNTVQYLVRDGKLNAIVNMRSNDAIFGYRNDWAWQKFVLDSLAADLGIEAGNIIWQTGSLHVYERHFYLVDHWWNTGETTITKDAYAAEYKTEWA